MSFDLRRLDGERRRGVALEVAELAPGPQRAEHHLVAVEADPHAAHLGAAVGFERDDVGEVRALDEGAGAGGEGDHGGQRTGGAPVCTRR